VRLVAGGLFVFGFAGLSYPCLWLLLYPCSLFFLFSSLTRARAILSNFIVLMVAAIPIATPVVVTATMALGARKMAQQNAVVTRLSAIEELAGMTVLCSDKTGTLTKNVLTIDNPCLIDAKDNDELVFKAALAAKTVDPDAIDKCVLNSVRDSARLKQYQQLDFLPFDPIVKRTEATIQGPDGKTFKTSKGAPQVILALAHNKDSIKDQVSHFVVCCCCCCISQCVAFGFDRTAPCCAPAYLTCAKVDQAVEDFANRGARAIAVAETDASGRWVFLGLISLFDPPRDDTKVVIEQALLHGSSVKMITGDHLVSCGLVSPPCAPPGREYIVSLVSFLSSQPLPRTFAHASGQLIAKETCRRLGMGDQILRSDALKGKTEERLLELVENVDGFAEVFPEDKFDIVALFQKRGQITGMTGDGVNDAPALRKANVGFAVEGATPAAQGAASVILLTPGLSVIITAIKRSRKIFQRLQNYLIYRVFMSVFLLLFFFIAIAWAYLNFPPVLIIFMCLILDLATMSLAYDKVIPSPKPNRWALGKLILIASIIGCVGAAANLILLGLVVNDNAGLGTIQTGTKTVCSVGFTGNTNSECENVIPQCYSLLNDLLTPSKRSNAAILLLNLHPLCALQGPNITRDQYNLFLSQATSNPYNALTGAQTGAYGLFLFPVGTERIPAWYSVARHPYTLSDFPYSSAVINTFMFLCLCLTSQFSVYCCRVDGWFFTRRPGYVLLAIISSEMFFTSIVAAYFRDFPFWDTNPGNALVRLTGLHGNYIGVGWLFGFIVFIAMELGKMATYRLMDVYNSRKLAEERITHEKEERRRRMTVAQNERRQTLQRAGTMTRSGTHSRPAAAAARVGTMSGRKKELEQPLLDADI
jgi:magnesium-transporting ATPase (P-type)